MSIGSRLGFAVGCSTYPLTMRLVYGYVSPLDQVSVWLTLTAPIVAWFGIETAARLWHRTRVLAYGLGTVAQCGAVTWWAWMYGFLASQHVALTALIGLPTGMVVGYVAAALISGRRLARPVAPPIRARESDEAASVSR